jgi:hypothetical protein
MKQRSVYLEEELPFLKTIGTMRERSNLGLVLKEVLSRLN